MPHHARRILSLLAAILFTAARLTAANTAPPPAASPTNTVDNAATDNLDNLSKAEILKLIRNLAEDLKQTRSELEQLKARYQAEKPRALPSSTPAAPATATATNAPAPAAAQSVPLPPPEAAKEPTEAEKDREQLERERAIRSVQRSGVLLPQGKLEAEPSFTYSHLSRNLINVDGFSILPVLVIGDIQSLRVERDVFQPGLTLRYGILPNLQADATATFRYEDDRYVTQSAQNLQQLTPKETHINDQGVGDTQFGLSYQLQHEHGWVPDLILQTEATAPTGKSQFDINSKNELPMGGGVWGVRTGLTAIKSLDPVILLFTAGYTYNFGRDFTVQQVTTTSTNLVSTTYEPGSIIDTSVALAIAMNPSFAINLGISEQYTFSTDLAGIGTVQGSSLNQSQFRFGFAWAMGRNVVFNFTAAAGLTEDTPGLVVTLSCPMKF